MTRTHNLPEIKLRIKVANCWGMNTMNGYTILENVRDIKATNKGLSFGFDQSDAELTFFTPELFRFRLTRHQFPCPERNWVVDRREWDTVPLQIRRHEDTLIVETDALIVNVELAPFEITVSNRAGDILCRDRAIGWRGHSLRCWKVMPGDARFYGCGEKVGFLDRRGRKMEMWTTDSIPHLPNTDPMYQSIPFFVGLTEGKAFGIFFNNTHRSFFDFGKEDPECYSFWAEDGPLDYYFIAGPNVADVVERYTELTGRIPLPPLWSLGLQQSRYSYYPESRVRKVAAEFRRRDIPCDVLYLDIHYMDGYRVFTWDPKRFPEPEKLLADLRRDGFKPVVIIDPGVKIDLEYPIYNEGITGGYFSRLKSGEVFEGEVWPGEVHFPDFIQSATRQWWGRYNADLIEQGVAGIWNDMNEPANFKGEIDKDLVHEEDDEEISHAEAHNVYGYFMCRATYEGLTSRRPDERPFILTRSGFAGIQRYAAVWLGDNHSWWEHLAVAVPMLLNMGLSGVAFVGVDVGGFCDDCSGELFARWIAMGCFTPFFRIHTAVDTIDQEPWSFGPEIETIARKFIKLRYELLPYIYNSFQETSKTGKPIMRPLLMEFQNDPRTHAIDDEYLFGPALLVAPVYRPGIDYRAVYLPEGVWYDFWTGEKLEGKRIHAVEAPLDRIPLFVRGGSVIPKGPAMSYVGEKDPDYLMLEVFPASEGHYEYYEDDGNSLQYKNGYFCRTEVSVWEEPIETRIVISERMGGYKPPARNILIKIHNIKAEFIQVDGRPSPVVEDPMQNIEGEGWRQLGECAMIRLIDTGRQREVRLKRETP